jgi:hypothetical protein
MILLVFECNLKYIFTNNYVNNITFYYNWPNTFTVHVHSLTLSLLMSYIYGDPSKARILTSYIYERDFYWGFASLTMHFVKICVKNQQIHQLFIQFINYIWYLLHVSALHCLPQGAFLVPSERCSIEEQSIEYCGWACCV